MSKKTITYDKTESLTKRLAKIRNQVSVLQKNKTAQAGSKFSYKYIDEAEVLNKVTTYMEKLHVSLRPNIADYQVIDASYKTGKLDKAGKSYEQDMREYVVHGTLNFTWVNDDDENDTIKCGWAFVGAKSDPSQAFGSALTYSDRYFLLKYFNIATPKDDPDAMLAQRQEILEAEELAAVKSITTDIKEYLSVVTDKLGNRDDVKSLVTKFMKDKVGKQTANYELITSVDDAAQLLSLVHEKFDAKIGDK